MVTIEPCGNSGRLLKTSCVFVKITSKENREEADTKHVLKFIRIVKSKSANCLNLRHFLEPVSMLKSPAMIKLSYFDGSWFAGWVVSSKNSCRLLLFGGL